MDQSQISTLPLRRARHPVCLDVRVSRADGSMKDSLVSDLSLEGCCITGRFAIGETVTLVLPRIGLLTGQVRWSIGNRTGIRFAIEAKAA